MATLERSALDTTQQDKNSLDYLFSTLKDLNDNKTKRDIAHEEFQGKIAELNKSFMTEPGNNLWFGPDGTPTAPPPQAVIGKQAGMKAVQDYNAEMERRKQEASVMGQLDAIGKYNSTLPGPDGGPGLPNPDDPRLIKAYIGPNGLVPIPLGQAKTEAFNEISKVYPAVKAYQTASPAVESYFKSKDSFKTETIRQASLISAMRALESSKVDPTNIAAMQSISQKYDAFMNKAMGGGGGLGKDIVADMETQLSNQYDELGGAFNNAIDSAPRFAKVPLGSKGLSDVVTKHVPVSKRGPSIPEFKTEAEALASGVKGKVKINGKNAKIE